jgi:hypothetical protein
MTARSLFAAVLVASFAASSLATSRSAFAEPSSLATPPAR